MMISCRCYNLNDEFMILKGNFFEFLTNVLSLMENDKYIVSSIICTNSDNAIKKDIDVMDRIFMIKHNDDIILSHKQIYSYNNFILYYLYSGFKFVEDCSDGPLVYNCDEKISFDMAIDIMGLLLDRYPYFDSIIDFFDKNRHAIFSSDDIISKKKVLGKKIKK